MIDVQKGLGVKNMSDLVRKKYMVFMVLKILQRRKLGDIKGLKKNWIKSLNTILNTFVVILWQE